MNKQRQGLHHACGIECDVPGFAILVLGCNRQGNRHGKGQGQHQGQNCKQTHRQNILSGGPENAHVQACLGPFHGRQA